MPLVVRLGDTGTHGGSVVTSAAKWTCEGPLIARLGDIYDCPLHGPNPIVEGSAKWQCEGAPVARHGDATQCGATLVSGAAKWLCE